jgi:hypothetical protein
MIYRRSIGKTGLLLFSPILSKYSQISKRFDYWNQKKQRKKKMKWAWWVAISMRRVIKKNNRHLSTFSSINKYILTVKCIEKKNVLMFAHVTHIHKLSLKCEQQLKEKDLSFTIRLVSCKKKSWDITRRSTNT